MSQVYSAATQSSKHRMIAWRGLFYAASTTVLQLPPFLVRLVGLVSKLDTPEVYAYAYASAPLPGILNMLVFIMQRREMRSRYFRMWRRILDVLSCYRPEPEPPQLFPMGRDLFATTVVEEAPPKPLSRISEGAMSECTEEGEG